MLTGDAASTAPATASLGMYDPPWLHTTNDALWQAVADALRQHNVALVPDALDRTRPLREIWRDRNLVLAQTCGWPLVTELAGLVTPFAAPVHNLPGCEGCNHCSVIVVAEGSPARELVHLRGGRAAINGRNSNTGMNLFRRTVAEVAGGSPFFASVEVTGAHHASLAAVREGRADVAAIDVVTFSLAARHCPGLVAGVRVLAETVASPMLPFVTCSGASAQQVERLRGALSHAIAHSAQVRDGLALTEVVPVVPSTYDVLIRYARESEALGYPMLA